MQPKLTNGKFIVLATKSEIAKVAAMADILAPYLDIKTEMHPAFVKAHEGLTQLRDYFIQRPPDADETGP